MTRKSTWENDLADFISDRLVMAFQWGSHDCALFAADCVLATTGIDPAADFRGTYEDQQGSRVALRKHGKGTLLKTFQDRFTEKKPAFAQRGDLIWNGYAIGVCYGPFALFVGQDGEKPGLVRVERSDWKRAFTV